MKFVYLFCFLIAFVRQLNAANREKKPTFRVTTILNAPYVVSIRDPSLLKGQTELNNKIFDGFLIDLLNTLSKDAGFNYNITISKDGMYGVEDHEGEWRGMIGAVQKGEADLALADLTITSQREQVVDFSYPFMNVGIGLLVKRPPYFLDEGPHGNQSMKRPLILYPVTKAQDLISQEAVEYGAIRSGSTLGFFMTTDDPAWKKIGDNMVQNGRKLPFSNSQGIQMVKESNGKYAFFMESSSIEYITSKECDLMQLGKLLNSRAYGIAMRKNFAHKTAINTALVAMQEKGILHQLKKKWFPQPVKCQHKRLDPVYVTKALDLIMQDLQ